MRNSTSKLARNPAEPQGIQRSAQVLQFRPRAHSGERSFASSLGLANDPDDRKSALLDELARYEQNVEDEPVNYRQRRLTNVISILVVAVIVGIGVWITNILT